MNKMTQAEFEDRLQAVSRARKIFINSGLTQNISHAFTLYQEIFADRHRPLSISSKDSGERPRRHFDRYERPSCPLCSDGKIFFKTLDYNITSAHTELSCSSPTCDGLWRSQKTVSEWDSILKSKQQEFIRFDQMTPGSKKSERKKHVGAITVHEPCPSCGSKTLYELPTCCGMPNGLIECGNCDFNEDPKIFNVKLAQKGIM